MTLPHTLGLSVGLILHAAVQQRLADHVIGGGSLLLVGRLPQLDPEHRPCTVLADALGLTAGDAVNGSAHYFPSLIGHGPASDLPETRVGSFVELHGSDAAPLFTDVEGRVATVTCEVGAGRAVVATTELPSHPALFTALAGWLGTTAGLALQTSVPGIVVTTTITPRGERLLHVLNPTGYAARVRVAVADPAGLLDRPLTVPARTGRMLGLGLELPGGGTIVSSNAEVTELGVDHVVFGPGLGAETVVWLRTDRTVRTSATTRVEGDVITITTSGPLGITFA